MNREEALEKALSTLHRIGGAFKLREMLHSEKQVRTSKFISVLEKKQMTDDEMMRLAFDTWEEILHNVDPKLPLTHVFHCELPEP